jgi:hypothetical protein
VAAYRELLNRGWRKAPAHEAIAGVIRSSWT